MSRLFIGKGDMPCYRHQCRSLLHGDASCRQPFLLISKVGYHNALSPSNHAVLYPLLNHVFDGQLGRLAGLALTKIFLWLLTPFRSLSFPESPLRWLEFQISSSIDWSCPWPEHIITKVIKS